VKTVRVIKEECQANDDNGVNEDQPFDGKPPCYEVQRLVFFNTFRLISSIFSISSSVWAKER
jgi:hypothetical protein